MQSGIERSATESSDRADTCWTSRVTGLSQQRGTKMTPSEPASIVDLCGASYRNFANELYGEIRHEAFGEDIGQTGCLTADEQ